MFNNTEINNKKIIDVMLLDKVEGTPKLVVIPRMTTREIEVLQLLAAGFTYRKISIRLDIGESTAKFHVRNVMQKLDAYNATEAVATALRNGIIS